MKATILLCFLSFSMLASAADDKATVVKDLAVMLKALDVSVVKPNGDSGSSLNTKIAKGVADKYLATRGYFLNNDDTQELKSKWVDTKLINSTVIDETIEGTYSYYCTIKASEDDNQDCIVLSDVVITKKRVEVFAN